MNLLIRTAVTVLLAAIPIFYANFIVPIWVLGQGMAGGPIFSLHAPTLWVEIAGLILIGLWVVLIRWLLRVATQRQVKP